MSTQRDRVMTVYPTSASDPGYEPNIIVVRNRLVDAFFFVLALRNFWRAANWIGVRLGAHAQEAIELFASSLPAAIELRNVIEHFDEYMESKGKMQQSRSKRGDKAWGKSPLNAWLQRLPNGEYILKVTDGYSTYKVDIAMATLAAETLYHRLSELRRGW